MGILQALLRGSKLPAYVPADDLNHALLQIDPIHFRVHSGHCFDISAKVSIPPATSVYFLGSVGDNPVHWNNYAFKANDGPIDIEFFRSPTLSSLGSSITARNRNDGSVLTPTMAVYSQPSTAVTADGTRLFIDGILYAAGTSPAVATAYASEDQRAEWILAANTQYTVKLTNTSASGTATLYGEFMWYEERKDSTHSST